MKQWSLTLVGVLALAGCASLLSPAETARYRCEGDREFILRINDGRQSAVIEFDRMKFSLRPAPTAGVPGEHFACDVMTVWREGQGARVEMEGSNPFRNCVRMQ
jgi:membrane-bound inhibitor of C-type lysozyme